MSKRVEELLKHFMHRTRKVRATHEIIAIELAAVRTIIFLFGIADSYLGFLSFVYTSERCIIWFWC